MGPRAVDPHVMATMLPLHQAMRRVSRPPRPEEHACEGEAGCYPPVRSNGPLMEIFRSLLLTGVLLWRTLSKSQLVDCRQLCLLKGV